MRWLAAVIAGSMLVVSAACDGGNDDSPPASATSATSGASGTSTPAATATRVLAQPSPQDESGAVALQVQAFVLALQEGSREQLQELAGEAIPLPEIDALATCIPEGIRIAIETRNIVVSGTEAVVTMALSIRAGIAAGVNRPLELRYLRDDGTWKLAQLPACPYDGI